MPQSLSFCKVFGYFRVMNSWTQNFQIWINPERALALPLTLGFAMGLTLITKVLIRALSARFKNQGRRSGALWDQALSELLAGTRSFVVFVWFAFLMTRSFQESARTQHAVSLGVVIATVFQVAVWGLSLIRTWNERILVRRAEADPSSAAALGLLHQAIQAIFIMTLVLMGLGNLGVNIGALIAGLGVGGIAVALAAQNILGDLLASLSIVLDKPFTVGDFIVAGNEKGTVESIGVKTTRIRSVTGEQIVLSNKDLLESRVRNFKRLTQRRVEHRFAIDTATPVNQIERIPGWVQEVFASEPKAEFERCQLSKLAEAGIEMELSFLVLDPDPQLHLDIQHRIFLGILRRMESENVALFKGVLAKK